LFDHVRPEAWEWLSGLKIATSFLPEVMAAWAAEMAL